MDLLCMIFGITLAFVVIVVFLIVYVCFIPIVLINMLIKILKGDYYEG